MTVLCAICTKPLREICPLCLSTPIAMPSISALWRGRLIAWIAGIKRTDQMVYMCNSNVCGILFFTQGAGKFTFGVCDPCQVERGWAKRTVNQAL